MPARIWTVFKPRLCHLGGVGAGFDTIMASVNTMRLYIAAKCVGAWKADTQQSDVRIAASRAKLYATEMAGRVADTVLQIFGGAGFMADLPVERMYCDLRGYRIGEGSSEMQRIQIARDLLAVK